MRACVRVLQRRVRTGAANAFPERDTDIQLAQEEIGMIMGGTAGQVFALA